MKRVIARRHIRPHISQTLHDFCAARVTDGIYRKNVRYAVCGFFRNPSHVSLKILGVHSLRMLIGDRLMNAVLSDRAVVVTGAYRADAAAQDGGREARFLYHYAPSDCEKRILSSGLLPKDRFVFLSDSPEYLADHYLHWKIGQLRAPTAFTLLQIDAQQLMNTQKIYCTDREHEFVTGAIDAKFISIES